MIIYDCEIKKAILKKGETRIDGIEYCDGWNDHAGMGISVACAYDTVEQRYHVFMDDNLPALQQLIDASDVLVSYNGIAFDNKLLAANGITVPTEKCYDIFAEVRKATGKMISLSDMASANLGVVKSMDGGFAPIMWQQRRLDALIAYCESDVRMTWELMQLITNERALIHPHTGGEICLNYERGGVEV